MVPQRKGGAGWYSFRAGRHQFSSFIFLPIPVPPGTLFLTRAFPPCLQLGGYQEIVLGKEGGQKFLKIRVGSTAWHHPAPSPGTARHLHLAPPGTATWHHPAPPGNYQATTVRHHPAPPPGTTWHRLANTWQTPSGTTWHH